MKPLAILVCLALSPLAWADGEVDVQVTVGWEGSHPVGWETWSIETRAEHDARMTQAHAEFGVWFETYHHEHPDSQWNVELSFGLFTKSVNAGFSFEESRDLAQAVVVEQVEPVHAHEIVKTVVVEAVAAEAEDGDPSDDEEEYKNLGQWVKAQVHSGLKGQELAAAIHEKIKERKEQKKAEKAARGKGKHDPTATPDDPGKGKPDEPGKGKGKGKGKDKDK